jgi:o-succinylbenzoate---CoA ligase
MQWLRSFTTGGQLVIATFSELVDRLVRLDATANAWHNLLLEECWLSLVPTQLQRLLQNPAAIASLTRFNTVLLGGAPAGEDLLAQARQHQIRLAPTYGMTETASQVVTLKPEAFLAGNSSCGQVLPHAKIQILSPEGAKLAVNQVGQIHIQSASLALGYYPQVFAESGLLTDDLGLMDEQGYLQIIGRSSQKIITGGENVFPAEVEAAIMATGLVKDVCVIGLPDREWGEAVTAIYVPVEPAITPTLQQALQPQLSKFKQPKRWLAIAQIPRNPQGKVNYPQLESWAEQQAFQD